MKWFNPLLALTGLTLASALPLVTRDAAQSTKDLQAVDAAVKELTTKVLAVEPGFLGLQAVGQALAILGDSSKINDLINKGAENAKKSEPYGDDGSAAVASAALDLQPSVTGVVDALIKKKDVLSAVLFGAGKSIVKGTLEKLRASTKNLGAAIVPKLNADFAAIAPSVLGQIDDDFARGIAAFS